MQVYIFQVLFEKYNIGFSKYLKPFFPVKQFKSLLYIPTITQPFQLSNKGFFVKHIFHNS